MKIQRDPEKQFEAYAPYNFIALDEKVVVSDDQLPDRSIWDEQRMSGVIECSLSTESPLYIGTDLENPAFFHHGDPDRPVIPGSSLRGMLRTLVEIITFSKLQPITDQKLFYRDLRDRENFQSLFMTRVGTSSDDSRLPNKPVFGPLVKAGIFHMDSTGYKLELCEMARVDHSVLKRDLGTSQNGPFKKVGERWFPLPEYQGKKVTADVDPLQDHPFPIQYSDYEKKRKRHDDQYLRFRKVTAISDTPTKAKSEDGILVLTGSMKFKHMEFVFLPSGNYHPDTKGVLGNIVERFESDDQITEWQEKAFPKDQPSPKSRRRDGGLRDGEPVFYLEDAQGELVFIGRAQLFRLPFGFPPSELRYPAHKEQTSVDMAEAMFGFVDKPKDGDAKKKTVAAGRVFVTDAKLDGDPETSVWLDPVNPVFHTHVLATPKPSAYAQYLVQDNPNVDNRNLLSNHRKQDAIIRGHKLYWHQSKSDGSNAVPLGLSELKTTPNPNNPAQHPRIKPIRSGVQFTFRVYFDNLTNAELGALLWAITLPSPKTSQFRHKLGMGKPLGMGSVRITIDTLQLLNPKERFGELFAAHSEDNDTLTDKQWNWATGLTQNDSDTYIDLFKGWIEDQLSLPNGGFDKHDRILSLRDMLRWPGLEYGRAGYMDFEASRAKLVLPRPQTVYASDRMTLKSLSAYTESPNTSSRNISRSASNMEEGKASLQIGTEIRVMITDITSDGVLLEPIGLPEAYEEYIGFISAADLGQSRYNIDMPARVIVVEIDDEAGEIRCRPRPKN